MNVQITDCKVRATSGFATNLPLSLPEKLGSGARIYCKKLDSPMHYPFLCPRNKKRPTWWMTQKKCQNYEKREKHTETKLPRLRNHHKIGGGSGLDSVFRVVISFGWNYFPCGGRLAYLEVIKTLFQVCRLAFLSLSDSCFYRDYSRNHHIINFLKSEIWAKYFY